MAEPDWGKVYEIIGNCEEHIEKNGVDAALWGECQKCPASGTCPNFKQGGGEDVV